MGETAEGLTSYTITIRPTRHRFAQALHGRMLVHQAGHAHHPLKV
jgi:hypothetical protein